METIVNVLMIILMVQAVLFLFVALFMIVDSIMETIEDRKRRK